MKGRQSSRRSGRRGAAWLALALLPALGGCVAAVAIPLVAGGTLTVAKNHRVHAATARTPSSSGAGTREKTGKAAGKPVLTSLKVLPPPSVADAINPDDPWQKFFAYALAHREPEGPTGSLQSAVLKPNPSLDIPDRRACSSQAPAVIVDLDAASAPFAPERLAKAPAGVPEGLARLREQGVVVLWISQLPAARADDVAHALQASGLDPKDQDQLLLVRSAQDRKQLLRDNASDDVCIVAIAGDTRSDFDELFDYLRNPAGAVGLYPMMGNGWFLVPPLDGSAPSTK